MLYILDTANLDDIKYANEFYPISGVTTNPSIIAKEKTDFWKLIKNIRSIIGPEKMLHIQTTGVKADEIIKEATLLKEKAGGNFYIKIPICEEGLKATTKLKEMGINVTITGIFTPTQALMAAAAGASFVAPYFNRIDNIIGNGAFVIEQIVNQFDLYGFDCKVLAASFKNAWQVNECAAVGCHSVTLTLDTMKSLISHPMTDAAIAGFDKDWKSVYGDKTILDF